MGNRFKLRLSRLILYFQSCRRSKNPQNLPNSGHRRSSLKHKFSPTLFSSAAAIGHPKLDQPRNSASDFLDFKCKNGEKFHLIEKTESPRRKIYKSGHQRRKLSKKSSSFSEERVSCETAPARLSEFMRSLMMPSCGAAAAAAAAEGKLRESFAVVKRSSDPYEDFKKSMMEMIIDKELFEEGELEQLLGCFLSLNSRNYHGIIVEAFVDIWGWVSVFRKKKKNK